MKTIIDFANKVKTLVNSRMSNIANVEESPSTHPYAVGKQLIFNGLLCNATSAIAVGDTLAVGTNLALSDNVVEQIYSLNQGLTNSLDEIADMNNVLGAKNLLPNNAVSQTISGVTLTKNSDGTVNVHGTNSSASWINHNVCVTSELKKILGAYKGKKLILSTTKDYDYDTNNVNLYYNIGGNITYVVPAPKEIEFTVPNNIDSAEAIVLVIGINAGATANVDNMGIMLRPASITDDTYVPYSMTNRELSDNISDLASILLNGNMHFQIAQMSINQSPFVVTRQAGESDIIFAFRGNQTYLFTADKWGSTGTIFASGSEVSVRASSTIGTTSDMTISNSSPSAFIFFIIKIMV